MDTPEYPPMPRPDNPGLFIAICFSLIGFCAFLIYLVVVFWDDSPSPEPQPTSANATTSPLQESAPENDRVVSTPLPPHDPLEYFLVSLKLVVDTGTENEKHAYARELRSQRSVVALGQFKIVDIQDGDAGDFRKEVIVTGETKQRLSLMMVLRPTASALRLQRGDIVSFSVCPAKYISNDCRGLTLGTPERVRFFRHGLQELTN